MPRGKHYTDQEKVLIAQAYAWATNDEIRGVEQKMSDFMCRVKTYITKHGPKEYPQGTFLDREESALERFISQMKRDVAKFMATLRKVLLADWSGLSLAQKVNIAVACYIGNAPKPGYEWKDFNPHHWPNYGPYKVLCELPQFKNPTIPSPPVAAITINTDDSEIHSQEEQSLDANSYLLSVSNTTPLKRQSSRGGHGVKKAKLELLESKKEQTRQKTLEKLHASIEKVVEQSEKTLISKKEDQ